MAALGTGGQSIVSGFMNLPDAEKTDVAKAIETAAGQVPAPNSEKHRFVLWIVLLIGLFVIALAGLVGAAFVVAAKGDASALLVIVSTIVAGSIGLFAKSPASS